MKKLGFIVNPIAGLGGSVGLKGTDGELYNKALKMGAKSMTPKLIEQFLNEIKNLDKIIFLTAPSIMGEYYLKSKELNYEVIGLIEKKTSSIDTKNIAKLLIKEKVEFIIFFGGDGTARDMFDSIGLNLPVIAVPTGVKMFSAVFAINARAAAKLVDAFFLNTIEFEEREVLDIDEDSYGKGILESKLYGYLKVPKVHNLIQASKDISRLGSSHKINKNNIALHITENMKDDVLYLLGPGTTVKAITDQLGLPKTLLGIDAIYNSQIVEKDVNEQDILNLMQKNSQVRAILSPIGAQGFILGRGNKQFTPKILEAMGKKSLIIIATREKLRSLKCLRIDSTDPEVDNIFKGFITVIVGYREEIITRIE